MTANTTDYRCTWTDAELNRIAALAHCVAPDCDPAGIALAFAAEGFTAQEAYDLIDHHYLDAGYVRSLCNAGRTVESVLMYELVDEDGDPILYEYQLAYVANDGSWDVARTFWACTDREAMRYADSEFPDDEDIYVLRDGRNINAGAY